jgi:AcrR family transcriptional regulator
MVTSKAGVVESARQLLDRAGSHLTVEEVARAAGVSRRSIYYQFGSRRGVIAAVLEDLARRTGYSHANRMFALHDPLDGLRTGLRGLSHAWSDGREAFRHILALGAIDPEVGDIVARFEAQRHAAIARLTSRLAGGRRLSDNLTAAEAAAALRAFTAFPFFDLFRGESSARTATDRFERIVTRAVVG